MHIRADDPAFLTETELAGELDEDRLNARLRTLLRTKGVDSIRS
ncbi:hypothetical protein [Streptomyces cupreus]|nr:hypothetical protein [Streptomyces cupreus]